MIRTHLDAGVYILSWRGSVEERASVSRVFRAPNRLLIGSSVVRLELARNCRNTPAEIAHFEAPFEMVGVWIPLDDDMAHRARELRTEHDLGSLDALHAAAAEVGVAERFVATEKPLYQVAHIGPTFLGEL